VGEQEKMLKRWYDDGVEGKRERWSIQKKKKKRKPTTQKKKKNKEGSIHIRSKGE